MKKYLSGLLVISLMAACAPGTQKNQEGELDPELQEISRDVPLGTRLLGNTLKVPETENAVAVDSPFLQGELIPFEAGDNKGTVRLLSQGMALRQGEQAYVLLPVEVLRVSGAGGLYLLLLEQRGATLEQRDAQPLGKRVRLLGLELDNDLITVTTIDSRLGKAPDFKITKGGVTRFRLREGKLVKS